MSTAWNGSHAPARRWRAGAWSLEQRDDELADIAYDGVLLLRAVRVAIRDRDWETATIVVERAAASAAGLELRIRSDGLGSSFAGTLRVTADGTGLTIECDLLAARRFYTNRTGLVVLHPPALAGTALSVTHPDGGQETMRLPISISPHQPVRDIAALAWQQVGLDVDIELEGDVFEMEDQRNWTDASFKTYSRPLDLPFPYRVEVGERVRQTLRIHVQGCRTAAQMAAGPERIEFSGASVVFPSVGLGAATAPDPVPSVRANAHQLLVELDLASPAWRAALGRAEAAGLPLDVRLIADGDRPSALDEAISALAGRRIVRVGVFAASGPAAHVSDRVLVGRLRDAVQAAGLDLPVIGGARSHFAELNREYQRLPDDLDGVVFSLTPLFHALSTEQLVESIAIQRLVAEQAALLAGGAPLHVGPVTLRPHFNDVATTPPPRPAHDHLKAGYGPQLLDADDARQASPELSAWTVASAAALAVPGVRSLTYFEEWGPRGIRDAAGNAYPVAAAIDLLVALAGRTVRTGSSADGLVWVLAQHGNSEAVVANLDARVREIVVALAAGERTADLAPASVTWVR